MDEEEYNEDAMGIYGEIEAEMLACQYDDDPNPYDGTYSED